MFRSLARVELNFLSSQRVVTLARVEVNVIELKWYVNLARLEVNLFKLTGLRNSDESWYSLASSYVVFDLARVELNFLASFRHLAMFCSARPKCQVINLSTFTSHLRLLLLRPACCPLMLFRVVLWFLDF